MIKGIGVDVTMLTRFIAKDDAFIKRILTPNEYQQFSGLNDIRQVEYLAGRFCGKEAYYKACKNRQISYHDVELLDDKEKGLTISDPHAHISISHDGDYVIAFVVVE
ncbi:MAG: holo-ACP synthase [Bacilli bacterium]|jgi:holo-[acyl-carrier protein] synthase